MQEFVFIDKECEPDETQLSRVLGDTYSVLKKIIDFVQQDIGETRGEWKFYGKKYGWQLKTFLKKRNLFFIVPYEKCFRIGFVFGDKAVKVIEASDLSNDLKQTILEAKKYGEGRGLPIDVKDEMYLEDIKKLIEIKVKN